MCTLRSSNSKQQKNSTSFVQILIERPNKACRWNYLQIFSVLIIINNQSIYKVHNLVHRDYSKYAPTHRHRHTHRHPHTQAYWLYKIYTRLKMSSWDMRLANRPTTILSTVWTPLISLTAMDWCSAGEPTINPEHCHDTSSANSSSQLNQPSIKNITYDTSANSSLQLNQPSVKNITTAHHQVPHPHSCPDNQSKTHQTHQHLHHWQPSSPNHSGTRSKHKQVQTNAYYFITDTQYAQTNAYLFYHGHTVHPNTKKVEMNADLF